MVTSPKEVDTNVEKLLDKMRAEFEPEQVNVIVSPNALAANCYHNVQEKIKQDGGKIHYGWVIWQTDLLCEAEHHAVWENDDGDLLCITPREQYFDTIMFVSDNSKAYNGTSFDNIRLNITGNPLIDDFIKLCEINEQLFAMATRENLEVVTLNPHLDKVIKKNKGKLHNIELFHKAGSKLGSWCFCQSGKTFNNCHGKNMIRNAMIELADCEKNFGR